MKNLEKLNILSDENQIDLESLNNFLLEKGDDFIKNAGFINKESITKEYFQENYDKIFRNNPERNSVYFNGDDFPVEWYTDEIINDIIKKYKYGGNTILYLNSNIDGYYKICEEQIIKNGYRLSLVPSHLIDYNLCEKAVLQISNSLEYVPKDIDNYYSLLKLAFDKDYSIIHKDWFPLEYLPKIKKDFPERYYKYMLKEHISKEVRKLLKEYYL
jgi:hypothetical protein